MTLIIIHYSGVKVVKGFYSKVKAKRRRIKKKKPFFFKFLSLLHSLFSVILLAKCLVIKSQNILPFIIPMFFNLILNKKLSMQAQIDLSQQLDLYIYGILLSFKKKKNCQYIHTSRK